MWSLAPQARVSRVANHASGSIYELGYQRYVGARLGRRHAVWALYTQSLRSVFGIGRSGWAKAAAFGLLAIALLPAVAQLSIAAIVPADVRIVPPEDYYAQIEPLLAIFCAVIAPELMGRDQRTKTLSLYFSRALRREDYAIAKYAAMVTAMLAMTLLPQLLMFAGNMSAAPDVFRYLADNWPDLPAIVGSALLLSSLVAGVGLAIACQTSSRTYSTVAIAAAFLLTTGIAAAIFEAAGPSAGKYALLLSPFHVARGFTIWIFGSIPTSDNRQLMEANIHGSIYTLDAIAFAVVCLLVVIRRYWRISV
jgi:ABC-2 type transport system permease protein